MRGRFPKSLPWLILPAPKADRFDRPSSYHCTVPSPPSVLSIRSPMVRSHVCALTLLLACIGPGTIFAQTPVGVPQGIERGAGQINQFARPGQPTLIVNVWGGVGQPGIWRVEQNVDLIELLSVVQVPGLGIENPGIRQKTLITLYRVEQGRHREVYKENLAHILQDGSALPMVQDGDVLAVTQVRRRNFGLTFFSSIVGTASSLTLLILRLTQN